MRNSVKKISVIVPVYNVEKYLRECLDSVINQTYKDIEIICVDDCGSDNSVSILEEYSQKDARIRIVHHSQNKGLAVSRNTGIEASCGDYIFFLDSDDYILPDTLEKLLCVAESSEADVTITKIKAFADDDTKDIVKRTQKANKNLSGCLTGTYQLTRENYIAVSMGLIVMAWGKLFSAKFIRENDLRFINANAIYEDTGFWLKVCSCFPKIVSTEDIGLMYRIRGCSIMSLNKKKKNEHDLMLNVKFAFDYFDKKRSEFAEEFKEQIKNNETFCIVFDKSCGMLYRYRWLKNNKIIKVLGIPIYREKINKKGQKTASVIGIPIYKKDLN